MISIVIPCYNESEGLPQLKTRLMPVVEYLEKSNGVELIFVDDGSTDNTNQLLHENFPEKNTNIIKHEKNMNLGAALRTGLLAAKGDIIVTMDSDCTYAPENIPKLLDELKDCDIVTASPYHPDGKVVGVPEYRLFLSRGVTWIYNIVSGKHLYTWTALFRAYKRDATSGITITNNDFIALVELLVKSANRGAKIKEVPETLYVRKYGTSKMRLLRVIGNHLKFISKLVFSNRMV